MSIENPLQNKPEKTEKEWNKMAEKAERVEDKLGKKLDKGIKETIVAFGVLDINTTASCEGHFDHGLNGPYIDIEAKNIPELDAELNKTKDEKKGKKIFEEIKRENLTERQKVMPFLEEFYQNRNTSYDNRLIIRSMARHWTRIQNQGVELQQIRPEEEKKQKLAEYQKEIDEFTKFLKDKYFER